MKARLAISAGKIKYASGFTLIELLTVTAIVAVLASLTIASLHGALRRAKGARCLSNLRQLGIAVRLYADDSGGRLPAPESNGEAGEKLIHLYKLPDQVAYCPSADNRSATEVTQGRYSWNLRLNSAILVELPAPLAHGLTSSIFYDRNGNWHGKMRNALFTDLSCGSIVGEDEEVPNEK